MRKATLQTFLANGGFPLPGDNPLAYLAASFGQSALKYLRAVTGESASGLYVVSDDDNTFYVGKSEDIYRRIAQHLGRLWRGGRNLSPLGRFILDNAPASSAWTITALTVDDVAAMTGAQFSEHPYRVDQAEQALISFLRPALNSALTARGCQSIPKRYVNERGDGMRAARLALGEGVE